MACGCGSIGVADFTSSGRRYGPFLLLELRHLSGLALSRLTCLTSHTQLSDLGRLEETPVELAYCDIFLPNDGCDNAILTTGTAK